MGTYLSTPVVEKSQESGEDLDCPTVPLRWGVVDMQGWRKSMEDAHVADISGEMKVFGVFDGHGGAEVARFCQLYMVDVLKQQQPLDEQHMGAALVSTFHAIDRMIDQTERHNELLRLRTEKPAPGEKRQVASIAIPPPVKLKHEEKKNSETLTSKIVGEEELTAATQPTRAEPEKVDSEVPEDSKQLESEEPSRTETEMAIDPSKDPAQMPSSEVDEFADPEAPIVRELDGADESNSSGGNNDEGDENSNGEADSQEAVGLEEAAKLDQDLMNEDEPVEPDDVIVEEVLDLSAEPSHQTKVAGMFKFLSLKGKKAQAVAKVKADEPKEAVSEPEHSSPASTFRASIIQNGRQICNLQDHAIHAGCTAVVAVLLGRNLTIANAGDSRAVLCRVGGKVEPLSFDHKPQQERELRRIRRAGGFVNQFGRVNGNLNLSRSIGDLKYKQVPGLTPAEQMITAEPDIVQTTLHPDDEFFLLGCDGIWDCLTNEEAVEYVRERIDTKTPTEIGTEMLDDIISADPRTTQGIGGDNMTIMIVDLQPEKRAYGLSP